jgi:hypothetical protein
MGHKMTWLVEKRVILLVYEGIVDNAEMQDVNEELQAFFLAGQKPVYLISDDRLATKLNTNLNSIVKIFSVLRLEGWGHIFTIGDSVRTRFFFKTLSFLLNMKMLLCPSTEIAIEELRKLDSSLNLQAEKSER